LLASGKTKQDCEKKKILDTGQKTKVMRRNFAREKEADPKCLAKEKRRGTKTEKKQ